MNAKPARAAADAPRLSADPVAQFNLLQRVRDATLSGDPSPAPPRQVIVESWRRSLAAQVNPDDYRPPLVYETDELDDVRAAHPLHAVLPPLRELLVSIADEAQHITIVTDADGTILWREGPSAVCRLADPVGLHEGTRWSESAIGTNAMGTALALDAPVQIYSAEHLVRTYHPWTCAAAPIHDPDTGSVLGAIDISGQLDSLHPAMISLVNATAQLAESHLRQSMERQDERLRTRNMSHLERLRGQPGALLTATGRVIAGEPIDRWPRRIAVSPGMDRVLLDDGREAVVEPLPEGYLVRLPSHGGAPQCPRLRLSFLGPYPTAELDGRDVPLTLRRAEILALLALHPTGLTAEQLALHLYGESGNPTTVRAEIHRLRAELGETAMHAKPYRLAADVDADFLRIRCALERGDVTTAAGLCTAPLLPHSEAPTVRAERDQQIAALRSTVLDHGDLDALWLFSESEQGRDDLAIFQRLTRELPTDDPRYPVATARLTWLIDEDA